MLLEWDPRDQIYIATVPELPGCRTHGSTREEATTNGREALDLWLRSAHEWGDPIPPPRYFQDLQDLQADAAVEDVVGAP